MSPSKIVLLLAGTSLAAGCAQTGPIGAQRTTLGSLKTSVSHLDFQNQQLRKKLAELESENRGFEDRLVQEEAENGDLTARLNDARNDMKRHGYAFEEKGRMNASSNDLDSRESATTIPAGRSTKVRRKPPFTQIPGRIEVAPTPEDEEFEGSTTLQPPSAYPRDDLGAQSRRDDPLRWLPVARGSIVPTPSDSKVR